MADFLAPYAGMTLAEPNEWTAVASDGARRINEDVVCKPRVCEVGGSGLFLPLFGDWEHESAPKVVRAIGYLLALLWFFMGVAIVADIFMGAIECITSKKVRVVHPVTRKHVTVKVWNDTVANLTLMALGSSAPEILLSVIELVSNNFLSGDLGPSTIVGSAAFNLLCITAVCISAIPNGEMREINDTGVFMVTAFFSIFAYLWLYLIVIIITPDVIDIWEGIVTFILFPVLVILAFAADKGWFTMKSSDTTQQLPQCLRCHDMQFLGLERNEDGWGCDGRFLQGGCKSGITGYHQTKGIERYRCEACDYDLCVKCVEGARRVHHPIITGSDLTKDELADIELRILQQHGNNLTDEQLARLIQKEHGEPTSRAAYRVKATRQMVGGKKLETKTDEPKEYSLTSVVPLDGSMIKEDPGSKPTVCPAGHTMQSYVTTKANYNCDVCQKRFQQGIVLFGCRQCNFDACVDCRVALIKADVTFQFSSATWVVLESIGTLNLTVQRFGDASQKGFVSYKTRDGTAKAYDDFIPMEGRLEFEPGQLMVNLPVKIVDDTAYEDDEEFFVDLFSPGCINSALRAACGENKTAKIAIVDDDEPGVLIFEQEQINVTEGIQNAVITVTVNRKEGSSGVVSCRYKTEDGTACAGRDYLGASGILTFQPGQMSAEMQLTVLAGHHYESTEEFRLLLYDPQGGATFDADTDGGREQNILTIVIESDEEARGRVERVMQVLKMDWDKAQIGHSNWKDQLIAAVLVNGGEEDAGSASPVEWVMHIITIFWKVLFACIPPADFCDGWLCFCCALGMIGLVTAFIGDLAGLLGCCLQIPDSITAITFVALGTSLPDTFASKTAAEQDPYADASVGNVTGSNSVNVFLGLGLPWMVGSIYWVVGGRNSLWNDEYKGKPKIMAGSDGKFIVIGGNLGFSVAVFTGCAVVCLALLFVRRKVTGGELGGPAGLKYGSSIFLTFLWLVYVGISSWKVLSEKGPCD